MTAIRDAMTKAGIDTAGAELRTMTIEALKFNRGNIDKASSKLTAVVAKRRDLIGYLVRAHVEKIAAEPEGVDVIADVTRPKDVSVRPYDVPKHERHRKRTAAERAAALRVAGAEAEILRNVFDRRINGRPIGDLMWGELTKMAMDNAEDAASFLRLGTEATANAILIRKIKAHTTVDDHTTLVRKVLGAMQLQTFIDEAYAEAPPMVALGQQLYVKQIQDAEIRV